MYKTLNWARYVYEREPHAACHCIHNIRIRLFFYPSSRMHVIQGVVSAARSHRHVPVVNYILDDFKTFIYYRFYSGKIQH